VQKEEASPQRRGREEEVQEEAPLDPAAAFVAAEYV
jgi:hypothetical protein